MQQKLNITGRSRYLPVVRNAFKLVNTTAPATVATTSSGANLDPDWTSPVAVTSMSKPPVQPPIRRTFLRCKLYQTTITWGDKDSFADYMHDCYGGDKNFTLMPVVPLDKVKHPWDEDLLRISARSESTASRVQTRITQSYGSERFLEEQVLLPYSILECMGREKKRSQNLEFLRLAKLLLRLRGAKSQKWFASTHFLRPEIANSLCSRKKS